MKRSVRFIGVVLLLAAAGGCGRDIAIPADADRSPASEPAIDGRRYLLAEEPDGAQEVISARQSVADDEDVVIVGRIGGSRDPWVEGRAAFSVVDNSLKACSDREGDHCPYPWDYCCESAGLPQAKVLVKIVDEHGRLVEADARKLLNVQELQTVVVRGKAQRDEAGNLTVLASGVFIKNSTGPKHESR